MADITMAPSSAPADVPAVAAAPMRTTTALGDRRTRRRYSLILTALIVAAIAIAVGILAYDNPVDFGTAPYWRIFRLRLTSVIVLLIVAFCHGIATVSFQTVTHNRIITPSILGFEAIYVTIQTAAVFVYGTSGISEVTGVSQFLLQAALMVVVSTTLFAWLLSGRFGNVHVMLLIGVVIGGGLASVSTFMQRLLTPSEFDILAARLFGNIGNAEDEYLPYALTISLAAGSILFFRARRLNVMALGPDAATNLGLHHKRELVVTLFLVSVLMAMTTALVGPMVFLGFLVATLAYQVVDTFDHRLVLPMAVLVGFVILAGAYFILRHVFYAQGMVTIIVEMVGGSVFLVHILRKGRL